MAQAKVTKFTKFTIEDDEKKDAESKIKKIMPDDFETPSVAPALVHLTPLQRMMGEIEKLLECRDKLEVLELVDNRKVNVAPKPLNPPSRRDEFSEIMLRYSIAQLDETDVYSSKSATSSVMKAKASKAVGFHMSFNDIIDGVGTDRIELAPQHLEPRNIWPVADPTTSLSDLELNATSLKAKHKPRMRFIRIILRKTEMQLLYEQNGMTSIKNTEDGNFAEIDNKNYDYLTIGRGKIRRRSEAEVQTAQVLLKSREANTKKVETKNVASYVSYFEMFDTYKMLNSIEDGRYEDEPKKLHISEGETEDQQFATISQLPAFHLASVIIKRLLAGNVFSEGQRRFRNMTKITRTTGKINYKYSLKELFIINPAFQDNQRKAVADMSFCYTNSDILAVGYGIYSYQAAKLPENGEVCVWSIKNPCDPERFYYYAVPVVSVEFSPYTPSLLAIGLFDGSVEVRDITQYNEPPLAISTRAICPGIDPILVIKWIKQSTYSDNKEIDPFLALSQNGSVTRFRIINSPFLSGVKLMSLERLEGLPEGLPGISPIEKLMQHSNRSPQGLSLTKHPIQLDIYYILTDEGCIYKCSTNYQHHYLQALRTHEGSVNNMDFSPWSPKLFVTCGNDWCLRVWMDGIFEPLVTLKNLCKPYNWAAWSRTHSTIVIAINGSQCEIWDLSRNILKPMSTIELNTSHNSTAIFSLDGTSILIGKERGQVSVGALDEMPFPSHCQYDTLEKAIHKALTNDPDLLKELQSIGYFGHPNKGFVKSL